MKNYFLIFFQPLLFFQIILLFTALDLSGQIDITDFKNGKTKICTSDGTGKSKGLKFQFKYPSAWNEYEADRPNIAKKLGYRNGEIQAMVYVYKLNKYPSQNEKKQILSEEGIKYLLSNPNYEYENVITSLNLKIDGEDATSLAYEMKIKRLDQTALHKSLSYLIVYKDYQVIISFGITTLDKDFDVQTTYLTYEPLFKLMASSFVIISKYE